MRLRPNPPGLPHAETRQKSHPEPSKTPPEPRTLLKPSWERLGALLKPSWERHRPLGGGSVAKCATFLYPKMLTKKFRHTSNPHN